MVSFGGRRLALPGVCCVLALLSACGSSKSNLPETRITISSTPEEGAVVLMAGGEQGITPITVTGLAPGWYDVLLKKDRFRDKRDRVEVRANQEQTFVIDMEPRVGYLYVESTPAGAEVFIDGVPLERRTPIVRHPLTVGPHTYEIRYPNHYPHTETIDVLEDFQYGYQVVHTLKPMEAILNVLSRPTGAVIYLNGVKQTALSPAKFVLAPGMYMVDVHTKGFIQAGQRIELAASAEQTVTIEMKQGEVPAGMVLVPAGEFTMGEQGRSPDESPRRTVLVDAFYIDKYEVTNAQFHEVFPSHKFPKGQEQFPVSNVSWTQASEYAQKTGKRLPTEAEWEKAARGTDAREYPWGADFDPKLANTSEADVGNVVATAKYINGASPYGCVDMAGNVYEWTSDWYDKYPGNTDIVTQYGQIFRVLRGGSYKTDKFHARCARRHFDRMEAKREDYGFRCAKDVPTR